MNRYRHGYTESAGDSQLGKIIQLLSSPSELGANREQKRKCAASSGKKSSGEETNGKSSDARSGGTRKYSAKWKQEITKNSHMD